MCGRSAKAGHCSSSGADPTSSQQRRPKGADFGGLSDIIIQNWHLFTDLIPSQHWLKQRMDELEQARHYVYWRIRAFVLSRATLGTGYGRLACRPRKSAYLF